MDIKNMTDGEKLKWSSNPKTSVDVLGELSKDTNGDVRDNVACNPNTPVDILSTLATDYDWFVRYYVAKHTKSSSKILVTLFEYEKSLSSPEKNVIKELYSNKNLPYVAKVIIETLFGDWEM